MTSKEALEKIKERLFLKENDYVKTFIPCILKISQDLERLEKLEKENKELNELYESKTILNRNQYIILEELNEKNLTLSQENAKLKKVIGILEKRLGIKIKVCINGGCSISILVNDRLITPNNEYLKYIDKEEYELLREVLENA